VATAFGLEFSGDFRAPGLPAMRRPNGRRTISLEFVTPKRFDSNWSRRGATRLMDWRYPSGALFFTLDAHPELGFRIAAQGYGRFILAPGGDSVLCAPFHPNSWGWQRLLISRVLPIAATIRGMEVFHAGAMDVEGAGIGLVANAGVGKTSLCTQLQLRGAKLLTDDLLTIEPLEDGELRLHPGVGVVSLRHPERKRLEKSVLDGIGTLISRGDKAHYEVPRATEPVPLRALYFIERDGKAGPDLTFTRMDAPDPMLLLGSTFVWVVRTPERLLNQLDVCTAVARSVPMFRVDVPESVTATATAAGLHEHVREVVGTSG
jgi:hypothetical protein